MARCTRSRVASEALRPAITRDTVIFETPARRATSDMRGGVAFGALVLDIAARRLNKKNAYDNGCALFSSLPARDSRRRRRRSFNSPSLFLRNHPEDGNRSIRESTNSVTI